MHAYTTRDQTAKAKVSLKEKSSMWIEFLKNNLAIVAPVIICVLSVAYVLILSMPFRSVILNENSFLPDGYAVIAAIVGLMIATMLCIQFPPKQVSVLGAIERPVVSCSAVITLYGIFIVFYSIPNYFF